MNTANASVSRRLLTTLFAVLVSMFACAGAAHAVVIFSDNFESPTNAGGDGSFAQSTDPTGWTTGPGGAVWGIDDPQDVTYTGTTGSPGTIANMSGPQVVSVFADNLGTLGNTNGTIMFTRALANTLVLGDLYTASISVGRRSVSNLANVSLGYVFELLAGSTVIASASADGTALANDSFTVVSFSHIAVVTDPIGQALSISFGTAVAGAPPVSEATDFDAVSLTQTVPEPASLSLVALASLGLLRRRRA